MIKRDRRSDDNNGAVTSQEGIVCWHDITPVGDYDDKSRLQSKMNGDAVAHNEHRPGRTSATGSHSSISIGSASNGTASPIAAGSASTASAAALGHGGHHDRPKRPSLLSRCFVKIRSVFLWVFDDFSLRHLAWIKLIFLFQSASMTVLYPYLNLHMKSLGLSVQEVAVINAVVPILFIFTPPLATFLAERLGNFRVLLSILTALGGLVALLLLVIPSGRDMTPFPEKMMWGLGCGRPENRARFQKLMLHGFRRDSCQVKPHIDPVNISFTPATCGYLCPTKSRVTVKPSFQEYKVIWPNRGGGFGISEIVDIVTLDSPEARMYHEPDLVDSNIFFPMNWTFHLSCDRIRPNDCIFNPIRRAPSRSVYTAQISSTRGGGGGLQLLPTDDAPEFEVQAIVPPDTGRAVTAPVNCGAKEIIAQVVSTLATRSTLKADGQSPTSAASTSAASASDSGDESTTIDTRFSQCVLQCMVSVPRDQICNNTETGVTHAPAITFWSYLIVRTSLGVLTAASLMMFEGAVMATIAELGGDYGIQRFVGNFGAIVFAPLAGYLIDYYSEGKPKPDFSCIIYIYLGLKLTAALLILVIRLDFRPPAERILKNICLIVKNVEVMVFLTQMMFAGTFWGYIESFLFWYLDDLGASRFLMGWTVAVGMVTSLPFLVFSGPITDLVGHINVIILGMLAYFVRLIGYSFLEQPVFVYFYEALEGLTMALMMTSAVTYVAKISSNDTLASVMGMMGALFFGVGKGSGALIGGMLMSAAGARAAFRIMAGNAVACAVFYAVFQCCYVAPRRRQGSVSNAVLEEKQPDAVDGDNAVYEDCERPPGVDGKAQIDSTTVDTVAETKPKAPSPKPAVNGNGNASDTFASRRRMFSERSVDETRPVAMAAPAAQVRPTPGVMPARSAVRGATTAMPASSIPQRIGSAARS